MTRCDGAVRYDFCGKRLRTMPGRDTAPNVSAAAKNAGAQMSRREPDAQLVQHLEVMRGQGRDDYPVRAMWNALVAGLVFQCPSIESLIRELRRNPALREDCGFSPLPIQRRPLTRLVRD
jgi:hypothetical protein